MTFIAQHIVQPTPLALARDGRNLEPHASAFSRLSRRSVTRFHSPCPFYNQMANAHSLLVLSCAGARLVLESGSGAD